MIEYTIFCDVCGDMIDSDSRSARQAKKRAEVKGLLVRIHRKDYCQNAPKKFILNASAKRVYALALSLYDI